MKRKLFSLLVLLMTVVTGAWAQEADNCPNVGQKQSRAAKVSRRAAANIAPEITFSFDCTSSAQYGVATDGEYIYTSSWSSDYTESMFFKYDLDGNFIEGFNISDCGNCRDMTYDGTYFYGVANGSTIYQIDFENKTVVGTINIAGMSMRGITYDPVRDGFWVVGNWSGPLALYDRNGTKIQEGIYAGSVSGMAYYEDYTGEEHILQLNNQNNYVYDYNITTNTNQGVVFNLNNIPGADGSSGGCFIGDYKGQVCMFADLQQIPNRIGIFPITNAKANGNLIITENAHGKVVFKVGDKNVYNADEGDQVTVTITPDEGWAVGKVTGEWIATQARAPQRRTAGIGLLQDVDLTFVTEDAQTGAHTYTFVMKRAKAEFSVSYRKLLTHTDMNIADIAAVTYNGQAQTPDVSVKDGSADLAKDQDFSVSYTDNLNAGTATATIVGIGNYSGQVVKTFTIQKANLVVTAPTARILTYTGQAQTLINAATLQGAGNTDNCQLQYSTDNQAWQIALPEATNAGSYTVFYKAVADANHNDVAPQSINVSVSKAALTSILIGQTNLVYNRSEQSPVIAGVKAGALNVPAEAYSVSGDKATTVGNYELTVTAKSDAQNYTGSAKAAYSIIAANAQIFTISDIAPQTYSGTRLKPAVTVKDGPAVLAENTDYTLTYSNNLNAGTATVTAQGIGNYTGTQTKTFEIQRANVALMPPVAKAGLVYTAKAQQLVIAGSAEGGEMQYSLDRQAWSTAQPTGTDAREYTVYYRVVADGNHNGVDTQNFKVTIGQATLTTVTLTKTYLVYSQQEQTTLVSKVNAGTIVVPAGSYDVTGNTATTVGTYTATVTGKGNFKGQVTAQYSIVAANASLFDITLGQTEYTYDGTAKTPAVTVKDGFTVLTENTDYTLTIEANTNAGTAKVTATGKGNYTGTRTKTFVIHPAVLTSVTLAQTEFSYNVYAPVAQTAEVAEVKAGNLEVPAAQYDVEGNTQTDPGLYTVTVTGKGNYTGSVTAQFVIKDMVVDDENVDGVDLTISVVDRAAQTLSIDNITLGTTASGEDVTLIIPAQINGWSVVNIAGGATAGLTNVTDVIMPDTEVPVNIGEGALPATATIHTPLALLGDYALMASLKDNYEAAKVVTTVTPGSMYWTLGLGCDVFVPSGIDVYTVQVKSAAEVAAEIIPEDLLTVNGERIIKANNGVLLLGEAGQSYDLVAYSGRIASGMPVTPQDLKDYGQENVLEPVIEKKDYGAGSYFVLEDNEFHAILAEGDEVTVPAGKAVLHLDSSLAGADALVLKIENGATGISSVGCDNVATDGEVYDLQGRRVVKAQKGLYIINGKKVMVK